MTTQPPVTGASGRRSLISLVSDLPRVISDLVHAEIASFQDKIAAQAKAAGVGAGLIGAAIGVLLFALGAFVTAAIAAIALALPLWASALIVGGALVLIAAILVLIGVQLFKRMATTSADLKASVEEDLRVITGTTIPGKD